MSNYVYGAIVALIVGYVVMLNIEVSDKQDDIDLLTKELKTRDIEYSNCKVSISNQNKAIDSIKLDLVAKDKELEEWKNKPAKVRYETIYKEIVKDRILKGDCDEVKSLIDDTTSINLNSL